VNGLEAYGYQGCRADAPVVVKGLDQKGRTHWPGGQIHAESVAPGVYDRLTHRAEADEQALI